MYRAFIREEDSPSEIDACLARAIIGLCASLSRLGHTDDALKHIEEAVDILRYLFHRDTAYKAGLSVALNNMANYSRDANNHTLALCAINESIILREELVLSIPELYKADLAASLLNASTCYSKVPYLHQLALEIAIRAVCIAEELVKENPGKFSGHLGAALHNRAHRRLARWQNSAAYDDIKKAVEIRRALATLRPDVYRGGLIRSLTIAKFLARQCQDGDAEVAFRDELQSLCKLGGPDYNDIAVNAAPQLASYPHFGGRDRTKIRYHVSGNIASPFMLATATTCIDQIVSPRYIDRRRRNWN
ncbi:hypothetical protein FB45DRAFT_949156 [Roridomyces roridus]|uniref:Uncharacterized protein n=1 Tax=Roridomyces roridus TaxID=1738132 RepID=A0AAD7F7B3_9AGAR|nr:hypothetical protein FB45DRAFT_949156 [Roridomyces roridus]